MHDRLRREEQHQQRRNRHRAQGQDRPVEHDADENDRDHDERALRRDLGAREYEIEGGYEQRGERRPFFDRHAIGHAGDQRQHRAQEEKHDAGDDRHVIARYREHVADAGNEHGVVKVGRDRVALARDQHRGDGAGVALDHGTKRSVFWLSSRNSTNPASETL